MTKYTIYAGDERPAFIIGQQLEKGSGQTMTAQGSKKIAYAVRQGDVGFPNMTEGWGIRLNKKGEVPESPLSVTSNDYDGKVKWLDWGEKGGCQIVSRWLSGYNTLDQQYQKLVLKADDRINDDSDCWNIVLKTGLNEFVDNIDALKIEHLKIHSFNKDSKSKNSEYSSFLFFEKNEQKEAKEESKSIDSKFDALGIVKAAAKDNSHTALRNLKKGIEKLAAGEVADENLYNYLLKIADSEPELFLSHVAEHKKYVSNIFVKANSFNLLDLTKNGVIAAGKDTKELVGKDIPAKGQAMLDYLLANCFEAEPSKTIFLIKEITDKIK